MAKGAETLRASARRKTEARVDILVATRAETRPGKQAERRASEGVGEIGRIVMVYFAKVVA